MLPATPAALAVEDLSEYHSQGGARVHDVGLGKLGKLLVTARSS